MTTPTPGPIQFAAAAALTFDRETRTIRGTITAYGVPTTDYRRIVIHAGALRPRLPLSRVKLLVDHDARQPVGILSELDSEGLVAAFTIPEGDAGDKALTEAANGLRDGLSVGINVLDEDGAFTYDADHGTYHVYAAELVEVSLCAIPAYDAGVTSVAAARETEHPTQLGDNTVTDTLTRADLENALDNFGIEHDRNLETRLANFAAGNAPTTGPTWPTFGAFVKELAAGNTTALEFYTELAYEGATTADTANANTWVDDAIHLVNKNRKTLNSFTRATLPAEGMNLEFVKLKSNSIRVAKQAAEGDPLVFGKIALESDTTPVDTYGGYTEVPRQVIDRASASYLSTAFQAMDIEYARATEAATRALVAAVIAAQIASGDNLDMAGTDLRDPDAWLDLIVDAAEQFEETGYTLEGTKVSKDVFKNLLRLEDSAGNRLMLVSGTGVNTVGEIDVSAFTGKLASVRFELLPAAPVDTIAFYDPLAITTWESAGAPFQLQDENIINLTTAFSKYGYLAQASQHPDAILPVKVARV